MNDSINMAGNQSQLDQRTAERSHGNREVLFPAIQINERHLQGAGTVTEKSVRTMELLERDNIPVRSSAGKGACPKL